MNRLIARQKPGETEESRSKTRNIVLVATLCGAQVLEVLSVTVVIVALPKIGTDLNMAGGTLQLVVSLYAVLYGSLLLAAGRVADAVGRRAVLTVGLIVTGIGTALCALATSGGLLLIGRAVQGVGGALVTPAALALLMMTFTSKHRRRLAVSAWTAAAAGGGALGFGAGGLMVDSVGWRAVFWLLTVVAVVVLALTWWVIPLGRPRGISRGWDPAGTVTAVGGLVCLVLGAGSIEDPELMPVPPIAVLVVGALLLGGFLLTQRRGRDPLLGWDLLTHRRFMRANAVAFVNTATTSASGSLVALVTADIFGLSPLSTGLLLLPFSVMVMIGAFAGGFWSRRAEHVGQAVGLAVVAVAMTGMAAATATRSLPTLASAVALAGLGLAWAAVTSTGAATAAVPEARQGTAAGTINTAAQVGTALGVALLLTLASVVGGEAAGEVSGYVVAFVVAGFLAGAAAIALVLLRRRFGVDDCLS